MKRHIIIALVVGLAVLALLGCGYNLVGRGGALPKHIKVISVPVFENETLETGLEALVTDAVVASLMKRGGLQIGDNSADARLHGIVVSYELKRLSYDTRGVPNEYRVAIGVRAELIDLQDENVLFSAKKLSIKKDYKVDEDISDLYPTGREHDSRDINTREQARQKALQLAAEDLAKQVVSAMLDTF